MYYPEKSIFMSYIQQELEGIKPVFSGHETFPLRYGWLKKVYDSVYYAGNSKDKLRDIFNNDEAIALFGVGKNMVSSMRHWATWSGIISDNEVPISSFVSSILDDKGYDPWLESPISLWILHWQLARRPRLLTYYWFFNIFNGNNFDKEQINNSLKSICEDYNLKPPSELTLKRDIDCFLRTYVSKSNNQGKISEDTLESPLAELGLINTLNKRDLFQPARGSKESLTNGVFLLVLHDFWSRNWKNQTSVSIESLVYDAGSPGRIFLLDEDAVLEKAYDISTLGLGIEWTESSGLRQFIRSVELNELLEAALDLIKTEYKQ